MKNKWLFLLLLVPLTCAVTEHTFDVNWIFTPSYMKMDMKFFNSMLAGSSGFLESPSGAGTAGNLANGDIICPGEVQVTFPDNEINWAVTKFNGSVSFPVSCAGSGYEPPGPGAEERNIPILFKTAADFNYLFTAFTNPAQYTNIGSLLDLRAENGLYYMLALDTLSNRALEASTACNVWMKVEATGLPPILAEIDSLSDFNTIVPVSLTTEGDYTLTVSYDNTKCAGWIRQLPGTSCGLSLVYRYVPSGSPSGYSYSSPADRKISLDLTVEDRQTLIEVVSYSPSPPPLHNAGDSTAFNITVRNVGDTPLKITGVSVVSSGYTYTVTSGLNVPFDPGDTHLITGTLTTNHDIPPGGEMLNFSFTFANTTATCHPPIPYYYSDVSVIPQANLVCDFVGPTAANYGETVNLQLVTSNTGAFSTGGPSVTELDNDSGLMQSIPIGSLGAGGSQSYPFTFSCPAGSAGTTFNFSGNADANYNVSESSETDNNCTHRVTCQSLDYTCSLRASSNFVPTGTLGPIAQGYIFEGETIQVQIATHNNGTVASTANSVSRLNHTNFVPSGTGGEVLNDNVGPLAAGATQTSSGYLNFTCVNASNWTGFLVLRGDADVNGNINETNENNNFCGLWVECRPRPNIDYIPEHIDAVGNVVTPGTVENCPVGSSCQFIYYTRQLGNTNAENYSTMWLNVSSNAGWSSSNATQGIRPLPFYACSETTPPFFKDPYRAPGNSPCDYPLGMVYEYSCTAPGENITFNVTVDAEGPNSFKNVSEADETNNMESWSVSCIELPVDLTCEILFSNPNPAPNESSTVTLRIINIGTSDVVATFTNMLNVSIHYYEPPNLGSPEGYTFNLPGLASGDYSDYNRPYTLDRQGFIVVTGYADVWNNITEGDESNNNCTAVLSWDEWFCEKYI